MLVLCLVIVSFQNYAQEKPQHQNPSSVLILYPEVFQIITLNPSSDFQLSKLEKFCQENSLNFIAVKDELSIFIKHSNNKAYEKSKEAIVEHLRTILKDTATIKSTQSYGREYLPSAFLIFILPSNLNTKHHPNLF